MMRKFIILLFSVFVLLALSITVSAHPGRTDSNGGHYNRDTGEYHYHNGEYAGQNQDNDTNDYSYSEFVGPTTSYTYNSNNLYSPTTEQNADTSSNSDKENGVGILLALFLVIFGVPMLWECFIGSTTSFDSKDKFTNKSAHTQTEDDYLKFLKPQYAERIKRQQEALQNSKTPAQKRLEQIAGFPDGIYIDGFVLNDTESKETYGRATAYINKKDKTLHLFIDCDNANQPINMLFDTYEMKNFKLCEKCKRSYKYDFYKNSESWYKEYINLKIDADKIKK